MGGETKPWRIPFYQRVLIGILVGAWALTLVLSWQASRNVPTDGIHPVPPFGIEWQPGSESYLYRDFPLLLEFSRQIWSSQLQRPYSLAGQEQLFRNWMPGLTRGMPVAYTPTVLVPTWPFQFLSAAAGYTVMSTLNLLIVLLLLRHFLFPRIAGLPHLLLMGIALLSVSFLNCLRMAHNPIVICALVAATWSVLWNRKTESPAAGNIRTDILAALALFILSAKPHEAFVLGTVLLAARRWRPVLTATAAFALVCAFLSPKLGGWPVWAQDYLSLIGGYHETGMGSFLYFGPEVSTNFSTFLIQVLPVSSQAALQMGLSLWLAITAVLLTACWRGKLSLHSFFLAQYANFFLFSPSLTAAADWMIVLLIAEAPFFRHQRFTLAWGAMAALIFAAVNLEQLPGTLLATIPIPFIAKALLAGWATVDRRHTA